MTSPIQRTKDKTLYARGEGNQSSNAEQSACNDKFWNKKLKINQKSEGYWWFNGGFCG